MRHHLSPRAFACPLLLLSLLALVACGSDPEAANQGADRNQAIPVGIEPVREQPWVDEVQALGTVKVSLDGKVIAEQPLVALQAVEQAGFFKRLWHSLLMWWESV